LAAVNTELAEEQSNPPESPVLSCLLISQSPATAVIAAVTRLGLLLYMHPKHDAMLQNVARTLTCGLIVFVASVIGCSGGIRGGLSLESATQVTLAELSDATSHLHIIHYLGSDADFHYIRGDERQYFRLPKSEPVPDFPATNDPNVPIGSFALFMTIRDGKLATPLPSDLIAAGYGDQIEF
jgi:hypothetical protein